VPVQGHRKRASTARMKVTATLIDEMALHIEENNSGGKPYDDQGRVHHRAPAPPGIIQKSGEDRPAFSCRCVCRDHIGRIFSMSMSATEQRDRGRPILAVILDGAWRCGAGGVRAWSSLRFSF